MLINVEANGKQFQEMHVDGGVGGQFFVAPAAAIASTSDYKIPATQIYLVANSGLEPQFSVVDRTLPSILTSTVSAAVKVDTRLMMDRVYVAAKRSGVDFNVASIPPGLVTRLSSATALFGSGTKVITSAMTLASNVASANRSDCASPI